MARPRFRPKRIGTLRPTIVKSGPVHLPAYPFPKFPPR